MPKLTKSMAKEVAAAASSSDYKPLDPGPVVAILTKCAPSEKPGAKGPYWVAEFTIPKDYPNGGRKFWGNLSLSEAARFKLAQFYAAFGDPDCKADTDDFIGKKVILQLGVETISTGPNMGNLRNNIVKYIEFDEDAEEEVEDDDADDDDEDDDDDI